MPWDEVATTAREQLECVIQPLRYLFDGKRLDARAFAPAQHPRERRVVIQDALQ